MHVPSITILQAEWHRNGICGEGFYAVLFTDKEEGLMVASLFDAPGHCAVYSVPKLSSPNGVGFGLNSWRGDHYEDLLRKGIKQFQKKNGSNLLGPFSAIPAHAVAKAIDNLKR